MKPMIEICCGSYYDALQAEAGGAERIELNSALHLGGLTPSLATLKLVKEHTHLKVMAMVRPRGGGFCYTEPDFEVMKQDCRILLEHGADGIVFGCLQADGSIHPTQNQILIDCIKEYHREAVFHRAFDCCQNPYTTIEALISMGVDRILTSGLKPKAAEGISLLKELHQIYGTQIQLLPGSGINASNARQLMKNTGIHQVHSACKDWLEDKTTVSGSVSFAYAADSHEYDYEVVSADLVRKLIESVS